MLFLINFDLKSLEYVDAEPIGMEATLCFGDRVSHWTSSLLFWLDWLTRESAGTLLSLGPALGLHAALPNSACHWVLGISTQELTLAATYFLLCYLSIPPNSVFPFLENRLFSHASWTQFSLPPLLPTPSKLPCIHSHSAPFSERSRSPGNDRQRRQNKTH